MNRFVFVGTGKDYVKRVWESLLGREDVQWFDCPFYTESWIVYNLCHLHSSFLLNKYFSLPFKSVWKKYYSIENADINENDRYFIILFDNALARYSPVIIEKFKARHPNVAIVLFMDNAMHKKKRLILKHLKNVDLVYTNNKYDSDKYGFKYIFNIIPPSSSDETKPIDFDVFFIGNAYDRLNILHSVYDRFEELNLRVKMFINGAKVKKRDRRKNIVYNKKLSYKDVIDYYNRSRCLLEVVGEKPTMLTMRTMEALIRNKKLITNHTFIKEQVFYNPKYILLFNDITDINIGFFNDDVVNYNFVNNFTPENFLKRVVTDCSKFIC